AKTWTFTTSGPTVKTAYPDNNPNQSQRRDAVMFVEFDQRIDPPAVLKTIRVLAGKVQVPIRLASREEIEADSNVKELLNNAEKDHWIAFRAIEPNGETKLALPAESLITIVIQPGTPSAEGPLKTTKQQEIAFRTFGALRIVKSQCGYNQRCAPSDPWLVQFSNYLDAVSFQESQVHVTPAVNNFSAFVSGNGLTLQGTRKPNTTY